MLHRRSLPSHATGLLFLILTVGAAARVRYYAACPSLWYDEAYLLLNVFRKSYLELLGPLQDDQAAPPLFLWCLRGLYEIAGASEWSMRLPALVAGLAGLGILVPLARRVVGRRGWIWAVALGAFCTHSVAHACEVKPYTLDILLSELVLLAGLSCLRPGGRRGWKTRMLFVAVVVLAPWGSFPTVFVAGAACLALLMDALRRRRRGLLISSALATGLFLLSCLSLWLAVGQFQSTAGLHRFWAASFVDLSSPGAALAWLSRCLVEAGNYAVRDMGLPLLALAALGAGSLWRRLPAGVVLLGGPLILALIACGLHKYPLGGRLLLFLAPCLWLLAARGLAVLPRWLPPFLALVRPALAVVLLLPAVAWVGRNLAVVTPRAQFREAFAHVHHHRVAGDVLWVSHPQVYEVYHGAPPALSPASPAEEVAQAAETGRLWVICR